LSRGGVKGDGCGGAGDSGTGRPANGRNTQQVGTITGYFRRDLVSSHVRFRGYLVDGDATTRHVCDVNY